MFLEMENVYSKTVSTRDWNAFCEKLKKKNYKICPLCAIQKKKKTFYRKYTYMIKIVFLLHIIGIDI